MMGFIFGLGGLIVWNAGGRDVLADKISVSGHLMAFFALLGMFYSPVQALSMFSSWLTGFVAAGQRVFEMSGFHQSTR
jgi:ABC-type bacteriocin/lantibiotic exporter with double-glycine peptidase domain